MSFEGLRAARDRLGEVVARNAIRARSVLGGRDYQRFLVVGVARTGSTLLNSLLNAQPHVIAFGEIFRGDGAIGWDRRPFHNDQSRRLLRAHETRPVEFLETSVFGRWPREIAAVGFKLFHYHARTGPQAAVWPYLRDDPGLAIIHLKRNNILEQYLSLRVAHATDVWSSTSKAAKTTEPIRLEPEACLRHFEEVQAQDDACAAFFAGGRLLTLTYEELVAEQAAAMSRVAAHLGLRLQPAEAGIVRQRTQPLSSAIANYDELQDYFGGSAWERFFQQRDTVTIGQGAAQGGR